LEKFILLAEKLFEKIATNSNAINEINKGVLIKTFNVLKNIIINDSLIQIKDSFKSFLIRLFLLFKES